MGFLLALVLEGQAFGENNEEPKKFNSVPFVITENGDIFSDKSGKFNDFQLASGAKKVLGAGRWVVIQGVAKVITNESPTSLGTTSPSE